MKLTKSPHFHAIKTIWIYVYDLYIALNICARGYSILIHERCSSRQTNLRACRASPWIRYLDVVSVSVRSAVIIPAKCLYGRSEGELRESARVDGRSLDESRHKLCRLMKSLLPKNSAEIYVLGELCAKASRFIYNFVSRSFCARAPGVLSSYLFSFSRGSMYERCVQDSVESLRCVARVDQYRPPKRVIYVVIFVVSIRKRSTRAITRDERAFKKATLHSAG